MGNLKLNKRQFDRIKDVLANTQETQANIAEVAGVSTTMVSVVNNARTWSNYKNGVKAKHPLRGPVKATHPTKVEKAKKAGLKPQTRDDRFEHELSKIADTYATKHELKDAIALQGEEYAAKYQELRSKLGNKQDKPTKFAEEAEERAATRDAILTGVIALVSLAALILAIAK